MNDWDFSPPPAMDLGDHDVPAEGEHLAGRRVALMITGGIAAFRAPILARALRRQGAEVVAFASEEGLRYVAREALEWATTRPVVSRLSADAEHLSDTRPFDAYLVAPATYNTINKLAAGIADGPLTAALASGLGRLERGEAKVLVVPTMHGSLHTSILTASLERLAGLGVRIVPPREDYGKHNIPSEEVLVAEVCRAVSRSPLAGVGVLVTGGPTPVPIDNVRRLINRFRGRLGALMAEELWLRGAAVEHVHGDGAYQPPEHLITRGVVTVVKTYDEYRETVSAKLAAGPRDGLGDGRGHRFGLFSAAVADYRPREVRPGKTPSGDEWTLELEPTVKVIEEVRERFPDLHMITFKYQEGIDRRELLAIARRRLERGYEAVVANRGETMGSGDEQVAHLVTADGEPRTFDGKAAIARGLADYMEEVLTNEARRREGA